MANVRKHPALKIFNESRLGTLQSGDYSVAGCEELFAMERKTIGDLVGCFMGENRQRFERELPVAWLPVCEAVNCWQ